MYNKDDVLFGVPRNLKVEKLVKWSPPCNDWLMLNTDGTAKGKPGRAGGGRLLRDCLGKMTLDFTECYGHYTAPRAELLAQRRGLMMARQAHLRRLLVHVDSILVANWMSKELPSADPHYYLILDCKKLLNLSDWMVQVHHCYREANRAADGLANGDAQCDELSEEYGGNELRSGASPAGIPVL